MLLAIIALLLIGSLFYPPIFRAAVRGFLQGEAMRHHVKLSVENIDGSLYEPLVFSDVKISRTSAAGTQLQLYAHQARAIFSWKNLLFKTGAAGFWQELQIDLLSASSDIPAQPNPVSEKERAQNDDASKTESKDRSPRMWIPETLDVGNANIIVRQGDDFARFDRVAFRASDLTPGEISVGSIAIKEPWLTTHFEDVRGEIALQNSRASVADLKLRDALVLQNASTDILVLLRGKLQTDFSLAAFGGTIRGEIKSGERDPHLNFDSAGTFSQISIAQLGAFLGEDADGTIREGKFTFHGSLRDLTKATTSTHLEATDFRWGKAAEWAAGKEHVESARATRAMSRMALCPRLPCSQALSPTCVATPCVRRRKRYSPRWPTAILSSPGSPTIAASPFSKPCSNR